MSFRKKINGFILLEVMLSVAILLGAVVGLTYSITTIIDTAIEVRQDRKIRQQLESHLRTIRATTLQAGTPQLEASKDNVTYIATVAKDTSFSNKKGSTVTGLWRIKISASYKGPRGELRTKDYEVLAYQP